MTALGADARLHRPAGSTAHGPYALEVTQQEAGWGWSSLRVLELPPRGSHRLQTGEEEMVVLPLAGSCTVTVDGELYELAGRRSVFTGVTDLVYLPRDAEVVVASAAGGRFALPGARCSRRLAPRYRAAADVPVEVRGAGSCSRQVNNFCAADTFEADRLIA
ncbi:MAG TPA: 5-deoxy-glucuronate isomerase, partial [Jiangellales bacterium]|nr:5-deoxy-glucuronate isomerase [Jiangellales bacterium]